MLFEFNFKSSILLIFFIHGIVFSFLLLFKGINESNRSNKWLSFFIFLCVCYISPFMLGYANWYSENPYREILFFIPFQQLLLIGPILYFYTQSLLNKSFSLNRKDSLHLIPSILYLIYSIIIYIGDKYVFDSYMFYADGRDKDFSFWYQILGLVSMVFYLILCLRYYSKYKNLAYQMVSYADLILYRWIQKYLIAFLIILILRVLFFILNPEWGEFGSKFWYYLCFSILFYYIALAGYTNTVVSFSSDQNIFEKEYSHEKVKDKANSNQSINSEEMNALIVKTKCLMQFDKIYEDPKLTLSDLAFKLQVTVKSASQLINQGFEMNFNDFINKQRIDAMVNKLISGENNKKTLLDMAFEHGFNSKATFNRAFKKQKSITPSKFVQNHIKK